MPCFFLHYTGRFALIEQRCSPASLQSLWKMHPAGEYHSLLPPTWEIGLQASCAGARPFVQPFACVPAMVELKAIRPTVRFCSRRGGAPSPHLGLLQKPAAGSSCPGHHMAFCSVHRPAKLSQNPLLSGHFQSSKPLGWFAVSSEKTQAFTARFKALSTLSPSSCLVLQESSALTQLPD